MAHVSSPNSNLFCSIGTIEKQINACMGRKVKFSVLQTNKNIRNLELEELNIYCKFLLKESYNIKMVKQKFSIILFLKNPGVENLTSQKSSVEVPAHCWSRKRKSENVHTEKHKRNSFTLPTLLLPQGSTAQCQERSSLTTVSPTGNRESL